MKSKAPYKVKKEILRIIDENDHSYKATFTLCKCIHKYTCGYSSPKYKGSRLPLFKTLSGIIISRDYSFSAFVACIVNGYMKKKNYLTN